MRKTFTIRETKTKILQACTKGATWTDLIKTLGISKATFYQHIKELQTSNLVAKKKRKYILTPKGNEVLAKISMIKSVAQAGPISIRIAGFVLKRVTFRCPR